MTVVNVGDIVQIAGGAYDGKLGIVKASDGKEASVRFALNNNSLVIQNFPVNCLTCLEA